MLNKRTAYITPGEFELIEILWSAGMASVREVWHKMLLRRTVAYTTVMTVLDKMHRKGLLTQRKQGKAHIYSPAIDRDQALTEVVRQVLKTYFNNSPSELKRFVNRLEMELRNDATVEPKQPVSGN